MKAVLDTNVLVSAALIPDGNEHRILRAWERGSFELVLSPAILEEVARVLSYEKIRKAGWMTEQELQSLLDALAAASIFVAGSTAVKASRDPDDDKFLSAAIEAEASYLVSGDRDLLALVRYRNVSIVRPAQFLAMLR